MCGIYGIYNYKANKFSLTDLSRMGEVLHNRGPDDTGHYVHDRVMLGHNRLSIIDLSPNGRQPMSNEDGTIWITANGEIYNFKELRKDLKEPHVFKSKTDTEVIIHAYEEMGESLWKKLEGMFAFALWDSGKQVFYLVRDHYGIKPLFYSEHNNSLIFSSQIKGIISLKSFDVYYNYQALSNYFSYFYVPGPETLVKDVAQLQAGCFLKIAGGRARVTQFNKLAFNVNNDLDEARLIKEIPERIKESVRKSAVSDVPIGLLLSGGMDSNILLAEMTTVYPEKIKSFTLGVKERSYDEGQFAREIAEQLGSVHFEEFFNYGEFDEQVTDIVTAVDCLNANPGLMMTSQYLKLASKHVKVAIAGSGGDELFAGYSTYKADMYLPCLQIVPYTVRKMLLKVANYYPVSYTKYSFDYVLKKFLEGSLYNREKAHYWWRTIFVDDEKQHLLNTEIINGENIQIDASYKYIERFKEIDEGFENKALYADFNLFLSDNALMLLDHLSMHFSLEVRPPLLHQEFVKYAFTIPYRYKVKSNISKYILREAYRNRLNKDVITRKKLGVVAPLGLMFKNDLKPYVQERLSNDRLKDLPMINKDYVQTVLKNHFDGRQDNGFKIWSLICLAKWNDLFYKKQH